MLQRSGNLQFVFHEIWFKHFVNLTWIYVRYHSVIVHHNQKTVLVNFRLRISNGYSCLLHQMYTSECES